MTWFLNPIIEGAAAKEETDFPAKDLFLPTA